MSPQLKDRLKLGGLIVTILVLGSVIFRQCSNHPLPLKEDSEAIVDSFKNIVTKYESKGS